MRLLTVITGILLALGGGFCYYFSTSPFSALAFVMGAVMVLSGGATLLTYVLSLRSKEKLPDTVFVEGFVTFLFGFAVLNNQISEAMLTTFFGTWLTLAGASRLSQSFSISRHNARDWAKIVPVALINTFAGVVMLMETLVENYNPVALVGTAFILNAISHFLHALYMRVNVPEKRAMEAKARAEAKEAAALEKRRQRRERRGMTRAERKKQEIQQKEAIAAEALKISAESADEIPEILRTDKPSLSGAKEKKASTSTMVFTPREAAEVARLTADSDLFENQPAQTPVPRRTAEEAAASLARAAEKNREIPEIIQGEFPDPWAGGNFSFEPDTDIPGLDDSPAAIWSEPSFAADIRPVWHKPTDIPSLRSETLGAKDAAVPAPAPRQPELKLNAINLKEVEDGIASVEFEPVKLSEVELEAEGGEADRRKEFLEALESSSAGRREEASFEAISLEDLFSDIPKKSVDEGEKKDLERRLTSEYTFNWPKNSDMDDH